ncbi:sugar transferase [Histidinibacterium lentulum]|uniref:Sugar transferase n=1 Tax=Histidinibacterium lentulum TaxID=2480588 RepID=A0A3N2QS10_9RHOB|nr:sugar transferase [Histidinibacterium lentulum]ROT97785.1 sugar transferase [Histidinibacterium lentulum]
MTMQSAMPDLFPRAHRPGLYRARGKRALDLLVVALLLPLALPLAGLLIALTWLDGGRPIYSQPRIGRHGQAFRCHKIRTMRPDAEARLAGVLAADARLAAQWAATQKLTEDPRVTRLGALLRRSSLDELPQLWNVLRGDMSLVGPRPVVPGELPRYGTAAADYTSVRPGISGLWQVTGRNATSYADRVALDTAYIRAQSLALDLRILLRTVGAVVRRTGH